MSNFSPFYDYAWICPIFCSPWFSKHFTVLQSWTKLLEKTKHEQHKNQLLTISLLLILPQNCTSLSHPLPLCNDNRTQTAKKPLTYCFSLLNSAAVTNLPPPSPLCNVDVGSDAFQENVRDPESNIGLGGGRRMRWFACLPVNALGRVMFSKFSVAWKFSLSTSRV